MLDFGAIQKSILYASILIVLIFPSTGNGEEHHKIKINLLDAVHATIANHPLIHLQKEQVELTKGSLQSATGQFDPTLNTYIYGSKQYTPYSETQEVIYGASSIKEDVTNYNVSLNKKLRSGVTLSSSFEVTRAEDTSTLGQAIGRINGSSINFNVIVPLLRNRGEKATGAEEKAAEKEYMASKTDLYQTISKRVLRTVLAYWNSLSAMKALEIKQESVRRAADMAEKYNILIDADERPRSDMDQILANLEAKISSHLNAEQVFNEAIQNLGLSIGTLAEELLDAPVPSGYFPEIILDVNQDTKLFAEMALKNRADLISLKRRQEAAAIRLNASKQNVKNQLDLSFNVGYSGVEEGSQSFKYLSSFYNRGEGLNGFVRLDYELPFKNNVRRGALLQTSSAYRQSVIRYEDLKRNIISSIIVAVSDVANSSGSLKKAAEAVRLYRTAVENERAKFIHGMSTVIDVIEIDDRLTNALNNEVSAHSKYAEAIARLRFATGTIVSVSEEQGSVTLNELRTLPSTK